MVDILVSIHHLQAVIVIPGFVIRSFDYPRLLILYKIHYQQIFPRLSADFAFFNGNMDKKMPTHLSLVFRDFGVCRALKERNPSE
jgi:hypothetical protein